MTGCSAPNCVNHSRNGYKFHRFPADPQKRQEWLVNCGRKDWIPTQKYRLCTEHFEPDQFERNRADGKRRLKPNAIPTIFNNVNNPPKLLESTTTRKTPMKIINDQIENNSPPVQLINQEAFMDTEQHMVTSDAEDEDTTITNYQKFEEIYIKQEPLDENSQDRELYEKDLLSVKKEECISDDDEQINKEYDNTITENNIQKTDNTNSESFCCEVCNKSFTWKSCLIRHMQVHNETDCKKFKCTICQKVFSRNHGLKLHMTFHTGKKFQCSMCHKKFTFHSNLNRHIKLHDRKKGHHECSSCNRIFSTHKRLLRHLETHIRIKEFPCPTCNKIFTDNSNLKSHMKIHSGIKDYKCAICNKQFTHNSNLSKHIKIHSKCKEYQCDVCEKTFARSSNLKKHMDTHSS